VFRFFSALAGAIMTVPTTHTASRVILAKPRAIFRTLLDPDAIPAWRSSKRTAVRVEKFNPRPGGVYRLVFEPTTKEEGGGEHGNGCRILEGRFIEILPDERIVEMVGPEAANSHSHASIKITTMLEPSRDGTKVTLIAQDTPQLTGDPDVRADMDAMLKSLANFVE